MGDPVRVTINDSFLRDVRDPKGPIGGVISPVCDLRVHTAVHKYYVGNQSMFALRVCKTLYCIGPTVPTRRGFRRSVLFTVRIVP